MVQNRVSITWPWIISASIGVCAKQKYWHRSIYFTPWYICSQISVPWYIHFQIYLSHDIIFFQYICPHDISISKYHLQHPFNSFLIGFGENCWILALHIPVNGQWSRKISTSVKNHQSNYISTKFPNFLYLPPHLLICLYFWIPETQDWKRTGGTGIFSDTWRKS